MRFSPVLQAFSFEAMPQYLSTVLIYFLLLLSGCTASIVRLRQRSAISLFTIRGGPEFAAIITTARLYGDGYLEVRTNDGWHRTFTACRLESVEIDNWYRLCAASITSERTKDHSDSPPSRTAKRSETISLTVLRGGVPLGDATNIFDDIEASEKELPYPRAVHCGEGLIATAKDCRFRIYIFDPHKPDEVAYYDEVEKRTIKCSGSPYRATAD